LERRHRMKVRDKEAKQVGSAIDVTIKKVGSLSRDSWTGNASIFDIIHDISAIDQEKSLRKRIKCKKSEEWNDFGSSARFSDFPAEVEEETVQKRLERARKEVVNMKIEKRKKKNEDDKKRRERRERLDTQKKLLKEKTTKSKDKEEKESSRERGKKKKTEKRCDHRKIEQSSRLAEKEKRFKEEEEEKTTREHPEKKRRSKKSTRDSLKKTERTRISPKYAVHKTRKEASLLDLINHCKNSEKRR